MTADATIVAAVVAYGILLVVVWALLYAHGRRNER